MRGRLLFEPRVVFREYREPDIIDRLELIGGYVQGVFGVADEWRDVGAFDGFRMLRTASKVTSNDVMDRVERQAGGDCSV